MNNPDFNQLAIEQLDSSIDSAIYYANESLAQNAGDAVDYNSYYILGYSYTRKNNYPLALLNYLKASEAIPEKKEFSADHADILMNLGRICKIHHNYAQAEKYYLEGLKYASEQGKSELFHNLGNLFKSKGNFQKSMDYYNQGLRVALNNNDLNRQVRIYNQIGLVFKNMSDYDKAHSYFETILNYTGNTSKTYKKYQAKAMHNMGNTYMHAGEYQKAIAYFKKALPMKQAGKEQFITLKDLGTCYTNTGQFEKASEYYRQAEALYPAVEPLKENIELFNLMSILQHQQEDYNSSFASTQLYYSKINQFIDVKENLLQQIQAYEIQQRIEQFYQEKTFLDTVYQYRYWIAGLSVFSALIGLIAYKLYRKNRENKDFVMKIIKNSKALS